MDNFTNQRSSYKPFNAPPCLGCIQNGMPSMMGQTAPSQLMQSPSFQGQLPTGIPAGPNYGTGPLVQPRLMPPTQQAPSMLPPSPTQDLMPIVPWNQPMPVTTESLQYMNGFIRTQIGRKVTIEFLIGTNTLVDKTGTLLAVGANYILINEIESDDILLCDFYAMKFMKFYY